LIQIWYLSSIAKYLKKEYSQIYQESVTLVALLDQTQRHALAKEAFLYLEYPSSKSYTNFATIFLNNNNNKLLFLNLFLILSLLKLSLLMYCPQDIYRTLHIYNF
jgi:hypothetical protein